jgi:hypothetical protein
MAATTRSLSTRTMPVPGNEVVVVEQFLSVLPGGGYRAAVAHRARMESSMYLYSTSVRLGSANPGKVMEWALGLTRKINEISEVPTALWTTVMSPAMGSLAWTAVVKDLAVIEATETKLAADPGYIDLVNQGLALASSADPVDQMVMRLVHGDRDAGRIDAHYASTVMANLAPGNLVAGIELGVDLAQRAKKITGCPTSFAVAVTGGYGAVMWVSLAETIQQLQAASEALDSDADFAKVLDKEAGKAYLPGATQAITRKVA